MNVRNFILVTALIIGEAIFASPKSLTYQGRIVKSDGKPLEYNSVSFQFEITDTAGSCVIYREQVNGINMQNSNGIFDVKIGATNNYPGNPLFSILTSFRNSGTFTCDGGVVYTPSANDDRRLRVQFFDGSVWRLISPDSIIRSVPFAAYANDANSLGARPAADYVLKSEINGNVTCNAGSFLTWNASTKSFGCATGGSGSGTLTSVTNADSYLSIANSTSAPSISVNVGQVSGTLAAGDDSRFTNARTPTGTASGDLTGNYPNPSIATIQGAPVTFTGATNGQFLKYNGTSWVPFTLPAGNSGTVTSITAGTGLAGGTITSSGTIDLGTELAAVNALSTAGVMVRAGAGSYTTTSASPIASADTLVQRDANGIAGFNGVDINGTTSGILSLLVPTIMTNYSLTFPSAQGGANQVLMNDGSGLLSWANMPTAPAGNCGANEVLTYSSGIFSCVPDQTGSAGTGITTFNGQTGSTQSLGVIGTSGTAPGWSSSASVHTLNIPMANTGSVTAGLISKSEYDAFTNKLGKSSNLSDLANVTTARTNLGLGTAAVKNAPTSGDAAAVEVVLGNDTRLAAVTGKIDKTQIAQCTTAQTLSYVSVSDTWSCQAIAIEDTQLSFVSSKGANTFLAAPSGSAGAPTFRTIASADLPSSIVNGLWTESSGNIYRSSGYVGIGTTSPGVSLDIVKSSSSASSSQVPYIKVRNTSAAQGNSSTTFNTSGIESSAGNDTVRSILMSVYETGYTGGSIGTFTNHPFSIYTNGSSNRRFTVDATGNVGVGTASPDRRLTVVNDGSGGVISLKSYDNSVAGNGSHFLGERARGSVAIPTEPLSGDMLATFQGRSIVSPNSYPGMRINADENFTSTAQGASIRFHTTGIGTVTSLERMRISPSGNVGIGVSSDPVAKLEVQNAGQGLPATSGSTDAALAFRVGAIPAGSNVSIDMGVKGGTGDAWIQARNRTDYTLNYNLFLNPNGGNVGIGTTTPNMALEVAAPMIGLSIKDSDSADAVSAKPYAHFVTSNDTRIGYIGDGSATQDGMFLVADTGFVTLRTTAAQPISFYTSGQPRMTVDSDGDLGVGTATPNTKLDIYSSTASNGITVRNGTSTADSFVRLYTLNGDLAEGLGSGNPSGGNKGWNINAVGNGGAFPNTLLAEYWSGSAWVRPLALTASGYVGIGTTNPSQKLHVVGNVYVASTYNCTLGNASGSVSCSSDERLKENIRPIPEALKKVLNLRGVEFDWNKNSNAYGRHDIGVIAQEVEKEFPTVIHENPDTGYKMVDYGSLVSPLIQAMREFYQLWSTDSKDKDLKIQKLEREVASVKEAFTAQQEENQQLRNDNKQKERDLEDIKIRLLRLEKLSEK